MRYNTILACIAILLLWLSFETRATPALVLDQQRIADTLRIVEETIYFEQYACVPDDINGTRLFLQFEVTIHNTGFFLPPPDDSGSTARRYLSDGTKAPFINYTLDTLNGTLELGCFRDTNCSVGSPERYRCGGTGSLGANCTYRLKPGATCIWIDVTDLPLVGVYTLELSLNNGESNVSVMADLSLIEFVPEEDGFTIGFPYLTAVTLAVLLAVYFSNRNEQRRKGAASDATMKSPTFIRSQLLYDMLGKKSDTRAMLKKQ